MSFAPAPRSLVILLAALPLCFWLGGCGEDEAEDKLAVIVEEGYELDPGGFHRAIAEGDAELVGKFLDAGFSLDAAGEDGNPPLAVALHSDQAEIFSLLLKRGANPQVLDAAGDPVIVLAARLGRADQARKLLRAGAPAHLGREGVLQPLSVAVLGEDRTGGDLATVKLLAAAAPEDLDAAFLIACMTGDVDVVDYLYSEGADVFYRTSRGDMPLTLAARRGNLEVVRYLLARGVDPFAVDTHQRTAGWYAADLLQRTGEDEKADLAQLETLVALLNHPVDEEIGLEPTETDAQTSAGWGEEPGDSGVASLAGAELPPLDEPAPQLRVAGGEGRLQTRPEAARVFEASSRAEVEAEAGTATAEATGKGAGTEPTGEDIVLPPLDASDRDLGLTLEEYHSRSMPILLEERGDVPQSARLRLLYGNHEVVEVPTGATAPGSRLELVGLRSRLVPGGKETGGKPAERLEAVLRDRDSGEELTLVAGEQAAASQPWALLRDGDEQRFMAREGDQFTIGEEAWEVMELRRGQVLLRSLDSGEVVTLQR